MVILYQPIYCWIHFPGFNAQFCPRAKGKGKDPLQAWELTTNIRGICVAQELIIKLLFGYLLLQQILQISIREGIRARSWKKISSPKRLYQRGFPLALILHKSLEIFVLQLLCSSNEPCKGKCCSCQNNNSGCSMPRRTTARIHSRQIEKKPMKISQVKANT